MASTDLHTQSVRIGRSGNETQHLTNCCLNSRWTMLLKYSCIGKISERVFSVCPLDFDVCLLSSLPFLFLCTGSLSCTANQNDFSRGWALPQIQHTRPAEKPPTRADKSQVVPTLLGKPHKLGPQTFTARCWSTVYRWPGV